VAARLAGLELHEVERLLLAIEEAVVEAQENRPPLAGGQSAPGLLGKAGAPRRFPHVVALHARQPADRLAGERRVHDGRAPRAADGGGSGRKAG
jgi:hypothetical protein